MIGVKKNLLHPHQATFRFVVYGDEGVGKSTFISSLHSKYPAAQISKDFVTITHTIDNETANYELYESHCENPHGAFAVLDLSRPKSIDNISKYYLDFRSKCTSQSAFFVIGNKEDISVHDTESINSLKKWCSEKHIRHFQANSLTGDGLSKIMHRVTFAVITAFQKERLDTCIQITKYMLKAPCCMYFTDPIDPEATGALDYYDVIKNPQDLSTILERLNRNEYISVEKWRIDVDTIFKNCETYNGTDSVFTSYIAEAKLLFKKLMKRLLPRSVQKCVTEITNCISKINTMVDFPAPQVAKIMPKNETYKDQDLRQFTDKDMTSLITNISNIKTEAEMLQMNQIMNYFHVSGKSNGDFYDIDVDKIPEEARIYLRSYFREKFHARRTSSTTTFPVSQKI